MGPEIHRNPYHVPIVRGQLTRNIGALYPEIIDEIRTAFHDVLNLSDNGEHPALILSVQLIIVWNNHWQNGRVSRRSAACKR